MESAFLSATKAALNWPVSPLNLRSQLVKLAM